MFPPSQHNDVEDVTHVPEDAVLRRRRRHGITGLLPLPMTTYIPPFLKRRSGQEFLATFAILAALCLIVIGAVQFFFGSPSAPPVKMCTDKWAVTLPCDEHPAFMYPELTTPTTVPPTTTPAPAKPIRTQAPVATSMEHYYAEAKEPDAAHEFCDKLEKSETKHRGHCGVFDFHTHTVCLNQTSFSMRVPHYMKDPFIYHADTAYTGIGTIEFRSCNMTMVLASRFDVIYRDWHDNPIRIRFEGAICAYAMLILLGFEEPGYCQVSARTP